MVCLIFESEHLCSSRSTNFATSFDLMNESRSGAAAFRPNELTMCQSLLQPASSPSLKYPDDLTLATTQASVDPPLKFKFWLLSDSHESYILSQFHRPRGSGVSACATPPSFKGQLTTVWGSGDERESAHARFYTLPTATIP